MEVAKPAMSPCADDSGVCERISSLEAHDCEVHKTITEMKNELLMLRYTKADLVAIKESTKLAKEVMDIRFEGMNDFLSQFRLQETTFLTRAEYMTHHTALEQRFLRTDEDIRTLRESRAEMQGKATQSQVLFTAIVAVAGAALSVAALLMR